MTAVARRSRSRGRRVYSDVSLQRLLLFACIGLIATPGTEPVRAAGDAPWKYDLQAGDHLTYRYTLERTYRGEDAESRTRATFNNQVVVLGRKDERISVGFQRNRESADLLLYKERGKDKLARELPKFRERMAKRPPHFSEAMEFDPEGNPLTYWEATRETSSKLIVAVHEIEGLPQTRPTAGNMWTGSSLLGLRFKLLGRESLEGKSCDRVEGADTSNTARLRYWWCEGTGAIQKLEFEAEYGVPGGTMVETARLELTERRRNENVGQWLSAPETRDATLQALILSPWADVSREAIDEILRSDDGKAQALAITLLTQRGTPALDEERRGWLMKSADPEVTRLARGMVHPSVTPVPAAEGMCEMSQRPFSPQRIGTTVRMISSDSGSYPYIIRVPGDYRGDRRFPLLIYLSGGAGLAIDGVNTADEVVTGTDYLVLYPQAGDYWWMPESRSRVDALLTQILRDFNVDTNRVYITGFSNGGTGAIDYAELWPQRFAAVVSLMGAGQCNPQVQAGLKNLTSLPVSFVHGEKDPRIGVECSRQTFESLKSLGPKSAPVLRVLETREHDVTLNDDGGLTLPFFADKKRDPWPSRFSAVWEDASFPRKYWVELVEKGPGTASVDARIQAPNRIEVSARGVKKLRILLRRGLVADGAPVTIMINRKKVFDGPFHPDCSLLKKSSTDAADVLLGYEQSLDFDVGK